jgi:hypothetical protein
LSDTRHSSSKRAAIDGHFYKREIFGCRYPVPGVPRTTAASLPPDHDRALTTRSAFRSC